jgi:DNA/RNA endonuclease G (NUC1)
MKKTLLFLFCGIAALCVSCKEGDDAATRFSFSLPEVVSVGSTTADVSSRAGFTLNDYPGLERGFAYGPADEAAEGYRTVKVADFERNAISARLTGLDPETSYRVHAYVKLGASRILSDGAEFTTLPGDGGGDGDGDGDGDGGGVSGPTRYSGWPELLAEQESNSDYYYAYHLCPDLTIRGYKARNYTVCFSAEHHCPVWVAAPRHDCYEGSANRTNAYKADPDIPSGIQYYSKSTDSGCNKGHMLGSAERTCSRAVNEQVFYYSNIAPQYSSGFNTGGGGWNLLEDWIDTKVCTDTTYLVIGTYFDRYEDRYGNTASPKKISFGNRNDVSCPTMFYIAVLRTKKGNTGKSVMECSADELMCAAFVRCHNNALKGKQVSSKDMYSIAELEELTGFTYFPNVPNAPKDSYKASDWGL